MAKKKGKIIARGPFPEDAATAASLERNSHMWEGSTVSPQLLSDLKSLAAKHFSSDEEKALREELHMYEAQARRLNAQMSIIADHLGVQDISASVTTETYKEVLKAIQHLTGPAGSVAPMSEQAPIEMLPTTSIEDDWFRK